MASLTSLGIAHTAISLIAVGAGFWAVFRDSGVSWTNRAGRIYIVATLITCLSGFGIFQHGGFGKAHALGLLTLLTLAVGFAAERPPLSTFRFSPYLATLSYSTTLFFHMIPGVTETFTRLPSAAPVFSSPEDPGLQRVIGVLFFGYLLVLAAQFRRLSRTPARVAQPAVTGGR